MQSGFEYGNITLNSGNKTYYPGQVIFGSLEFNLETPLNFSAIVVQFSGEASVEWSENRGEVCTGREEYFNVIQPLIGGTGSLVSLPAGPHRLEFKYPIPFHLPSSYKGEKGSVNYYIRGHADAPNARRQTLKEEFIVVAVADLNGNENKPPIELEFEEVFSCCLCSSDPLSVRVTVPGPGFCPGQKLPVTAHVTNKSSVEVLAINFALTCRESYHSKTPISDYIFPETVISEASLGTILTKTEREYTVDVPVPDMVVPNLDKCSLIDVEYFLNVEIKVSGCNEDLTDAVPILLGNISLLGNRNTYIHPSAHRLPEGPIPKSPESFTTTQYLPNQSMPFSYTSKTPYPKGVRDTPYPDPQNAPYPNPQATPYPNPQNTPYPNPQATPYPKPQNTPYPNHQNTPYPNPQNTPYPNPQNTPYPNPQNTSYLNHQNAPYPNPQYTPYPNPQAFPQNNLQWNGSNSQNVGFSVQPAIMNLPSAPPS